MKKRIFAATTILLMLVLATLYFIPSYNQKELLVRSPIIHAARELSSPAEWERWNPALRKDCLENPSACAVNNTAVKNTFSIKAPHCGISVTLRGAMFDITQTGGDGPASYNYTLIPSLHDDSTGLVVTEKRSLLVSLFSSLSVNSVAWRDADSLKKFIETPSDYYGFPLQMSPVIDTLVITTHKRIAAANSIAELKGLYRVINHTIEAGHLTKTYPYIANYRPVGHDSIELTAAIPVDKKIPKGALPTNMSFMEMPPQGRMVVGYFKGKYGDRIKLYKAMDNFISDKLLKKISVPYEEYLNDTVPENDSTIVEIKICAPVI